MDSSEQTPPPAKEPVVLDAQGHTLHDPSPGREHVRFVFQGGRPVGILSKLVLGAGLIALLAIGTWVALVAVVIVLLATLRRVILRLFR